ncbi:MAG: hypothetical protein JNM72_05435 [Deltaproteobacteria bacterium]|nr:hypothetical protein [Deltaproteobacteria bacterium]
MRPLFAQAGPAPTAHPVDRAPSPDDDALSALHQNLADVTRGRRDELVGLTLAVPGEPEALRERLRGRLVALGYPALNLRLVHSTGGLVLIAAEFIRLRPQGGEGNGGDGP